MAERLVVADLLAGSWRRCAFQPFRPGVEICHLVAGEPAVALLRYEPGAGVPRHRHAGLETILVLDGAQSDENGDYETGAMVANPVGSEHSVWSDGGCVVLMQWEKPVVFV